MTKRKDDDMGANGKTEKTELVKAEDRPLATAGGFESTVAPPLKEVGAAAAMIREESEIKARIVSARRFPRNEMASYERLMKSCSRASFAEGAAYRFPRGGQTICGPSVDLAREAARLWGNIHFGLRTLSIDEENVHIMGFAFDAEANNSVVMEDKFRKLIQRRADGGGTQWVKPDERDLRELINRRGAICVRNAILQVLPPDIIDEAMRQATVTMRKAVAGEILQDPVDAIRRLALAFASIGVTVEMLERKLEHPLALATGDEIVDLRQVFKSISDGHTKRGEHFEFDKPVGERQEATGGLDMTAAVAGTPPPAKDDARTETKAASGETDPPLVETKPRSPSELMLDLGIALLAPPLKIKKIDKQLAWCGTLLRREVKNLDDVSAAELMALIAAAKRGDTE